MKKIIFVLMLLCVISLSTGCMRVYSSFTVNEDGTVTVTSKQAILKQYVDEMGESSEGMQLETLEDGQQYYTSTETETSSMDDKTSDPSLTLTKDIFYYAASQSIDDTIKTGYDLSDAINSNIYVKICITLTDNIVDTNANVTAETTGKTAAFDSSFTNTSWYAYTAHGKELIDADTTAPVIDGIKDGSYYKTMPAITFSDDTAITQTLINGQPYSIVNVENGKNVITATDIKGNTSTVTFYVDSVFPTIKGIINGKTYKKKTTFYVKDDVALSKITIDGKKQKLSNSKLVKKGKYKNYYKLTIKKKGKHNITATDNAGNRIKVKIKIK